MNMFARKKSKLIGHYYLETSEEEGYMRCVYHFLEVSDKTNGKLEEEIMNSQYKTMDNFLDKLFEMFRDYTNEAYLEFLKDSLSEDKFNVIVEPAKSQAIGGGVDHVFGCLEISSVSVFDKLRRRYFK